MRCFMFYAPARATINSPLQHRCQVSLWVVTTVLPGSWIIQIRIPGVMYEHFILRDDLGYVIVGSSVNVIVRSFLCITTQLHQAHALRHHALHRQDRGLVIRRAVFLLALIKCRFVETLPVTHATYPVRSEWLSSAMDWSTGEHGESHAWKESATSSPRRFMDDCWEEARPEL